MSDPKAQAAKQLANILGSTGKTVAQFVAAVRKAKLDKHGEIVAFFKQEHGLTHGNANLLAHVVRDELAGGPAGADDLLAAQYAGKKEHLLPIYERLAALAEGLGDDVTKVVQKTGVTFRRKRNFLVVNAASAKRVQIGLNLDDTPPGERIVAAKGMCNHKASLHAPEEVDDDVASWVRAAYERA